MRIFVFYGGGSLESEVLASGVSIVSLGKAGRWDQTLFMLRLGRALKEFPADVIHTYGPVPNIVGVLLRPLVGMTPVVWGVGSAELDWSRYERIVKHTFRVSAWLSRGAAAILVNSVAGIRYHRSIGYPAETMHHVPNGIDLGRFRPDPDAALRDLDGAVVGARGGTRERSTDRSGLLGPGMGEGGEASRKSQQQEQEESGKSHETSS